jgi:hypothetical protein
MKKSIGWSSVTPSSFEALAIAASPIRNARSANACEPSYQWTRTMSPATVRHW